MQQKEREAQTDTNRQDCNGLHLANLNFKVVFTQNHLVCDLTKILLKEFHITIKFLEFLNRD